MAKLVRAMGKIDQVRGIGNAGGGGGGGGLSRRVTVLKTS